MDHVRMKRQRGDGLVEFALILPILMLLVMGILDLGRAVYAYSVVANCAREGCRYASVTPGDDLAITAVCTSAAVGLDATAMTVTVFYPTTDSVRVHVSYQFQLITLLVAQAISGRTTITLASQATMYTGY